MINPPVVYGAIGALLLGLAGGWTVRDWKADSDALAAADAARKAQERAIAAANRPAERFETVVAELKPLEIETRNTIREVYRNVEIPADCAVPTAGVSLLDAARVNANAAAAGEPLAELRRASPTPVASD